MFRLFRGIAVPGTLAKEVISSIREGGLTEGQGTWRIEQLWKLPSGVLAEEADLISAGTSDAVWRSAVCACGTLEGAAYYAWQHNRSETDDTPILIEFEAHIDDIRIDGRDFLYMAFQWGEPERARSVLKGIYGSKILRYAELAWASENQGRRIALCDLATLDPDVALAHYANSTVIEGRYGTTFNNAFTVALPVAPEVIVRVWAAENRGLQRTPSVTLGEVVAIRPSQTPDNHHENESDPSASIFDAWNFKYKV